MRFAGKATYVLSLSCSLWCAYTAISASGFQTTLSSETFITGTAEAVGTVARARAIAGLDGIQTVLLDGVATTPATAMLPESKNPRTYRFLLPDTFQERTQLFSRDYIFCFSPAYWQNPPADDPAESKRNKLRALADWWILVLERAPTQFPLTVATTKPSEGDFVFVTFSNPDSFVRRAIYSRQTGRLLSIEHDYLDNDRKSQRAKLSIKDYAAVNGKQLPRVVEYSFRDGSAPTAIDFSTVLVNSGVSANDFRSK